MQQSFSSLFPGNKKAGMGFISKNKINTFIDLKKFSTNDRAAMIADLNYLKTMSGGDSKFIAEMIDLFREQVDEYEVLMPELLQKKDYNSLSKMAHKAKSSVAVMGMNRVAELLKELEILASEKKEEERYESMVSEFLEQSRLALLELEDLQTK
jgi:HPt (histidine-containing phosphotransfer) domain-containing protein